MAHSAGPATSPAGSQGRALPEVWARLRRALALLTCCSRCVDPQRRPQSSRSSLKQRSKHFRWHGGELAGFQAASTCRCSRCSAIARFIAAAGLNAHAATTPHHPPTAWPVIQNCHTVSRIAIETQCCVTVSSDITSKTWYTDRPSPHAIYKSIHRKGPKSSAIYPAL